MTSLVRAKQLVLLTNFGSCKKVGPWPTRCVHKVGSYQTSLVRARKLVILWPAWYVQNSWSSWPTRYVKKVGPWPTRCMHKVGSYQTSSVRARKLVILWLAWYVQNSWSSWPTRYVQKKLVPGQLRACIKSVFIKPAWYLQESWLSYDMLGTWKTAGPLDQLRTCKKVGPWPTRSVHKVGSYQTSLVRARMLVILWRAWYVQNSWSSWPTLVRAKKLVPGQLGRCIKLALIKPAWYVQESWLSYDQLNWYVQNSWSSWPTWYEQNVGHRASPCVRRVRSFLNTWTFKITLPVPRLGRRGCASLVLEMYLLTSWWYSAFRRLGAMFVGKYPQYQIGSCVTGKCWKRDLVERLRGVKSETLPPHIPISTTPSFHHTMHVS